MAMQAGMGFSKVIILVGAGCTGTLVLKNGNLSDVLGELQNLIKGLEQKNGDGDVDSSDAMAALVRRLAMEVRQLASAREITILNGSSGANFTNIAVPAATLGALGYAYMWWKGIKVSDLMYVTKAGMTTAVSNLTKHLEHVSDALAATKRHLTQRIENLDGKMDEQIEISKLIRNEVTDARGDISQIGYNLDDLQRMVTGLDGKLLSLESKQELANAGVMYLCNIVNGKRVKMPENLQEQLKFVKTSTPSLMGLKDIADGNMLITNGTFQDSEVKPVLRPRSLTRTASIKC